MIKLKNISKTFSKGTAKELRILDKINFEISKGEFAILLGNNGSGKSTLLKTISGDLNADSGELLLDGNDITSLPAYKRSKYLFYVQQTRDSNLVPNLSVLDLFMLAKTQNSPLYKILSKKSWSDNIVSLLSSFKNGLENRIGEQVWSLSGGEHQMITLLIAAEVIKNNPKTSNLLLLDEHIAHLDPNASKIVMEFTTELIKEYGLTTLMVTHNITIAQRYGNRILAINNNSIVYDHKYESNETRDINKLLELISP